KGGRSALQAIRDVVEGDRELSETREMEQLEKGIYLPVQSSDVEKASQLWYAQAEGHNLLDVFMMPGIDRDRTTSNDIDEIYRLFGIEAARSFLVSEIRQNLGSYIDNRHIELIASFMTVMGYPTPISYHGVKTQRPGPLSSATIERPMEIFS